jgi:DNA adenine methylase
MKFLRYPGGKRKLLSYLEKYFPDKEQLEGRYIEPFVGGGAVFWYYQPSEAILADLNKELIDLYGGIKLYPRKVWRYFKSFPVGKRAYYKTRDTDYLSKSLPYRAARTLYLNRTCFKGMWRHDTTGKFNVGYGGEERRWVITQKSIEDLSQRLQFTKLLHRDFETVLDKVRSGDFIFLDPPYKPGEKEMYEAHYINGRFSLNDQKRLAKKLKELSNKKNIKWMMTNSSHRDIRKLYKDFAIRKIPKGTSSIIGVHAYNSNEILITNY